MLNERYSWFFVSKINHGENSRLLLCLCYAFGNKVELVLCIPFVISECISLFAWTSISLENSGIWFHCSFIQILPGRRRKRDFLGSFQIVISCTYTSPDFSSANKHWLIFISHVQIKGKSFSFHLSNQGLVCALFHPDLTHIVSIFLLSPNL